MAGAERERLTVRLRLRLAVALQQLAASIAPALAADDLEALRSRFPDAPDEWLALVRRGALRFVGATRGQAPMQADRVGPRSIVAVAQAPPPTTRVARRPDKAAPATASGQSVSFAGFEKPPRPVVRFAESGPGDSPTRSMGTVPQSPLPDAGLRPPAAAERPDGAPRPALDRVGSKRARPRRPAVRYASTARTDRPPAPRWPEAPTAKAPERAIAKGEAASLAAVPPVQSVSRADEGMRLRASAAENVPPGPAPSRRGQAVERLLSSERDARASALPLPSPILAAEPTLGRGMEHHPTTSSRPSEGWDPGAKLREFAAGPWVPAFAGTGNSMGSRAGTDVAERDRVGAPDPWPELPRAAEAELPTAAFERARLQKLIAEQEQRGWSGSRF